MIPMVEWSPGYFGGYRHFNGSNVCIDHRHWKPISFLSFFFLYSLPSGLLGALQVEQEFYGRGLGLLVSKWLSRKIAETGHNIGATVFERNTHSLAIFKKLGFTIVDRVYWTDTLPIQWKIYVTCFQNMQESVLILDWKFWMKCIEWISWDRFIVKERTLNLDSLFYVLV